MKTGIMAELKKLEAESRKTANMEEDYQRKAKLKKDEVLEY